MDYDKDKLVKARAVIEKMANGVNPINGEAIREESFLHDGRVIRCLFYISEVLNDVIHRRQIIHGSKPSKFIITPEEKSKVVLKEGYIGVNEFAKCINSVIDLFRSKRPTGVELNKQLKKMGLLGELKTGDGKTRTVVNDKSIGYGIESQRRNYNGVEYDAIVFNDKGKNFLLDNLERIMEFEE